MLANFEEEMGATNESTPSTPAQPEPTPAPTTLQNIGGAIYTAFAYGWGLFANAQPGIAHAISNPIHTAFSFGWNLVSHFYSASQPQALPSSGLDRIQSVSLKITEEMEREMNEALSNAFDQKEDDPSSYLSAAHK